MPALPRKPQEKPAHPPPMPQPLTPLNALWRSKLATPPAAVDDRELIRMHCGWGGHYEALEILTQRMNEVADIYPPTVATIQDWLDRIDVLEQDHADAVEAGTAHLANAEEYEGPIPGTAPTREQQLSTAGKLQWDTSLLKARYRFGGAAGAAGNADGQRRAEISQLRYRILDALALDEQAVTSGGFGYSGLVRS